MPSDDELTARLTTLLHDTDPVPPAVIAAARHALSWRDPDAQLAQLAARSAAEPAGVRGESAQLLTFSAGAVVIDVEVEQTGRLLSLIGQVAPPGPGRMVVEQPGRVVETPVDAVGRFTAADLPPGPIRLRYQLPSGTWVKTEWHIF